MCYFYTVFLTSWGSPDERAGSARLDLRTIQDLPVAKLLKLADKTSNLRAGPQARLRIGQ